jgi:hypothetical protein
MIVVKEIGLKAAERFFLSDPKLCELSFHDSELDAIKLGHSYEPSDPNAKFFGLFFEGNLGCVVRWERFTETAVSVHPYLLTVLQKQGVFGSLHGIIKDWFVRNTFFTKLVVFAPAPCVAVHKAAKTAGMVQEGLLTKTIKWRNELVDLHIYAFDLTVLRNK